MIGKYGKQAIRSNPERGAALISVILLLGLLSLFISTLTVYVTSSSTAIFIERDEVDQRALIKSSIEFGVGRVLSLPKGEAVRGKDKIRLESGTATIEWRGENSRLNLNFIDDQILASLIASFDINKDQASSLARLIIARRGLNPTQPIPNEYRVLAGRKLGPYDHVRELLDIPNFPTALFERIEPYLTVYGASERFDPRLADRRLIEAIPDITRPQIIEILALSNLSDDDARSRASLLGESKKQFDFSRSQIIRFLIDATNNAGKESSVQVVVIHFPDDEQPYRILLWNEDRVEGQNRD